MRLSASFLCPFIKKASSDSPYSEQAVDRAAYLRGRLEYASNYRRDRRVIRALMSGGSGLLAGQEERRTDKGWKEREARLFRRGLARQERTGIAAVPRDKRPLGRARGGFREKREDGTWRTQASRDRQIYGTATSFSPRGGLDLTRSCPDTGSSASSTHLAPNATALLPASLCFKPRFASLRAAPPRAYLYELA